MLLKISFICFSINTAKCAGKKYNYYRRQVRKSWAKKLGLKIEMNTPPETVRVDRTNGAAKPLKWCKVTAAMVH